MRKAKLDAKSEKSADVYFDNENSGENEALYYENSRQLSEFRADKNFSNKSFLSVLKKLFLFLPGAFLLFFISFAATIIATEIIVFGRRELPDDFLLQFALIGSVMISGTLMTWFGLGDIKNKKHFAIPASIIVTGAMLGAFIKAASKISDFADRILDDFDFLIYLFPLALIVPVLVKAVVDRKTEDA